MCSSLYPCIYVNSHFEVCARFQQYCVNPPILGIQTWKACLQRRCRDPLVVSFLCLRTCSWLDGHVAMGCGSYIAICCSSVGWTHVLRALVASYICGQHVYSTSTVT